MNGSAEIALAREASLTAPTAFACFIGGYMGHSYQVELAGTGVLYTCWDGGYTNRRDEHVDVRDEDWTTFRTALDTACVWAWEARYEMLMIDGTNWHVSLTWGERVVESTGANGYPTRSGKLSRSCDPTPSFVAVLKAIETLIGGRPFR